MTERRNDIGAKVMIAVVVLLVTTIVSFSIVTAGSAVSQATANAIDISYMKANFISINGDIAEIKLDVRELLTISRK